MLVCHTALYRLAVFTVSTERVASVVATHARPGLDITAVSVTGVTVLTSSVCLSVCVCYHSHDQMEISVWS